MEKPAEGEEVPTWIETGVEVGRHRPTPTALHPLTVGLIAVGNKLFPFGVLHPSLEAIAAPSNYTHLIYLVDDKGRLPCGYGFELEKIMFTF